MDLQKMIYMAKLDGPLKLVFRAVKAEEICGDANSMWEEVIRPFVPEEKKVDDANEEKEEEEQEEQKKSQKT
jgi:hypothetical protein